jgi:hypothetical protein
MPSLEVRVLLVAPCAMIRDCRLSGREVLVGAAFSCQKELVICSGLSMQDPRSTTLRGAILVSALNPGAITLGLDRSTSVSIAC